MNKRDVKPIRTDAKDLGPGRRSGMALIITLLTLGLMTIIVVAFLGTMSWELTASRRDYDNQRARAMATLGMNMAVAQLRSALGVWDNPFVNFTNTVQPTYYWSVSPGILTRWAYTSTAPLTNYPLFSIDPNGATNLVNLNAQQADGSYPIIGGANPPNVSVYWANVLSNPSLGAGAANPIVGRYAFWVDDENAKININTADGTLKYTANSLGLGTPSEVSLQVLQQGGSPLSTAEATNIVYIARTTGFNSAREILRTPGSTPDLYTNNVFNLTTWGRSPELNVFGEPKINLISASIPFLGPTPSVSHGILETNNITGQALTEIYPTPSQLPPFKTYNPPGSATLNAANAWRPLVVSSWASIFDQNGGPNMGHGYQGDGESWMTYLIQGHLGGTNSVNEPITWPVFPGTTGTNFLGKYSLRQLDALATEITDEVGRALVPEAYNVFYGSSVWTFSVPSTTTGLLSREPVCGLGRSAKINEIYISATTYGGLITSTNYVAPYLNMAVYVETYLPAGFAGVDLLNANVLTGLPPATNNAGYSFGSDNSPGLHDLNLEDLPTANVVTNVTYAPGVSAIPRSTTTGDIIPPGDKNSYWADCILRNDQGIDFFGNPPASTNYVVVAGVTNNIPIADPDQARAAVYHSYLTNSLMTNNPYPGLPKVGGTQYPGNGTITGQISPLFQIGYLSSGGTSATNTWYPGQYRTVNNGTAINAFYMTNADSGTTLHITGGLIVTASSWNRTGDPDPTPFEAGVQASAGSPSAKMGNVDDYDGAESNSGPLWPQELAPGNANQTSKPSNPNEIVRDRLVNGSIPVNLPPITVPAASSSGLAPGGPTVTYDVAVVDPLVNKFPGDWIPTSSPTMGGAGGSPPTMRVTANGGYAIYYNGQNFTTNAVYPYYFDPDSFWMPTLDPKIPRSARFPNIGYLNYLRTGVFPDDETVPIRQQHGTPYRCLNFNAVGDPSQANSAVPGTPGPSGYPDWAILDLFTIPSTLLPYGGPYGYYKYPNGTNAGTATWTAGALFAGNPTNMYYYGTWGGSTPGRINPNGAVVYTTNVNTPTPGITRLLPLEALTTNIMVNQTIPNGSGTTPPVQLTNAPTFTGGAAVNASNVASAIATYLSTNSNGSGGNPAPLREPAEICNILGSGYSAVSGNPGGDSLHNNPTRNDLVRQIVGNLTTQSNVFSIWVEGQTITKSKANTNYGIYQSGDQITGSVRYHFVVERYLQPGAGGIYGNTQNPTPHFSTAGTNAYAFQSGNNNTNATGDVDGIMGTYDDPADLAYHPVNPRYLYRVVYAEEIRD